MATAGASPRFTTSQIESREFRRMLGVSTGVHVVILVTVLLFPALSRRKPYVDPGTQSLNVMWARPVGSPKKTTKNKLPAPIVRKRPVAPKPKQKAKVVLPKASPKKEKVSKKEEPKIDVKELHRQRKMAEALASISQPEDERPMPKADNFPSPEGKGKGGIPGSAGGGISGALGGDPRFLSYKQKVQTTITNNFVWLQKAKLTTEVTFQIDAGGHVVDAEVKKSSGNPAYDRAALRAVSKSSPLPPPPDDFARDILRQRFVIKFDPEMQ